MLYPRVLGRNSNAQQKVGDMTRDEARRIAQMHGLTKLSDHHLDQFAASIQVNEQLSQRLPQMPPAQEMALTFKLKPRGEGTR